MLSKRQAIISHRKEKICQLQLEKIADLGKICQQQLHTNAIEKTSYHQLSKRQAMLDYYCMLKAPPCNENI